MEQIILPVPNDQMNDTEFLYACRDSGFLANNFERYRMIMMTAIGLFIQTFEVD